MAYNIATIIWDLDGDVTVARHMASTVKSIPKMNGKGWSIKKVVILTENLDNTTLRPVETTQIFRLQLIAGKHTDFVRIYDKRLICEAFDSWDLPTVAGVITRTGVMPQIVAITRPVIEDKISMVVDFTKGSWAYKMRIVAQIHYARVKVDESQEAAIKSTIY